MTGDEKRADLKAHGLPWPDCDCHDEAMLWQKDKREASGGRFHCRVAARNRRNTWRQKRRDQDLCIRCGGQADTESMCRPCADGHADYMATPRQRIGHQFADARLRARRRTVEGFRPTGVGLAVFAAWTERTGDDQD